MMNFNVIKTIKKTAPAVAISALFFSSSAFATLQYDFTASANGLSSGANVSGMTFSEMSGSGGPDVTVTGWSNNGTNSTLQGADLFTWSGLGVDYGSGDGHSTDNANGYDSVLFSFDYDIELSSLSIGWYNNDSDMTVLAYTGASTTPPVIAGLQYQDLSSQGWSIINHTSNVHSAPGDTKAINSGSTSSSYWLIGAYNPLVGNSQGWTTGNDFVKISALTGTSAPPPPTPVPAPMPLALLGIGLLGMMYTLKRRA